MAHPDSRVTRDHRAQDRHSVGTSIVLTGATAWFAGDGLIFTDPDAAPPSDSHQLAPP